MPAPSSSVAAGKKPMAYAPSQPATAQSPARTARAGKAPVPAHGYSAHTHTNANGQPPTNNPAAPHKPRPPAAPAAPPPKSKLWSTNTNEERERIKEFWLALGEQERRNLVKIEKETVLRKMKEQQKHSCSCAVCGRKRNAIEEELEVLYDAYYDELEQYANYQQRYVNSGGTIPPPPGPGPFPGSVELDKNGAVVGHNPHPKAAPTTAPPTRPKQQQVPVPQQPLVDGEGEEDEYEEEEEYEDDEEDDEEDEEEEEQEPDEEDDVKIQRPQRPPTRAPPRRPLAEPKPPARDGIFNLRNSLTVTGPGNILTVADDLLKNDGQKFLEMMEQLAERRMQREEEAAADVEDDSEDEDDDGEDDDDEDDEEDDEEEDEEEEEVMTEEQKMEEGKHMFSIFAARMFEQRVLQAYRERVAQERQLQLLRELEDEDKLSKEREAKKQTQNQKKKDKKKQQKQAKEEEKAQKAAEIAAKDSADKARKAADEAAQRKRKEEERLKLQALKRQEAEDASRKRDEAAKREAEAKERTAKAALKAKQKAEKAEKLAQEKREAERKAKEEADRIKREAKVAADKIAAEKAKEKEEREERERKAERERLEKLALEKREAADRAAKAAKIIADKEREEKLEREARERLAMQHQQARAAAAPKRGGGVPLSSPRNNATASGSRVPPLTNGVLKKPIGKPSNGLPQQQQQQQPMLRQQIPQQQQQYLSQQQLNSRPPIVTGQQQQTPMMAPVYPQGMYAQQQQHQPVMSPRMPGYPPAHYGFAGPQQGPLAPSALPRNFGAGPSFDPTFVGGGRGLGSSAPIGPPSKVQQSPSLNQSPISPIGPPSRRASILDSRPSSLLGGLPDPGPVARPLAPIGRPGAVAGASSPNRRRSPSPTGHVTGSSALKADDDEVVLPPGRRSIVAGTVGQGWGPASPRAAAPPWGAPAPLPHSSIPFGNGASPSRVGLPSTGSGAGAGGAGNSLWGNAADWQQTNFFQPPGFHNHNPSPPPH